MGWEAFSKRGYRGRHAAPRERTRWLEAKAAGTFLAVAALGMLMGASTRASFSDLSPSDNNGFTTGSVSIEDNDAGDLMLSLTDAKPGASTSACIKVTYTGTLFSSVRMYGTTTGTGLATYLGLTITRGTYSSPEPQFASCTNFTPDSQDYLGVGSGVVYSGTLEGFPDTYGTGLIDAASSSVESWGTSESHVYRITVTLLDDSAAEGKNATQAFTWEARNE